VCAFPRDDRQNNQEDLGREEWRVSPSFPPHEISSFGRVRYGRRVLHQCLDQGHPFVHLRGRPHLHAAVSALVAEAFGLIDVYAGRRAPYLIVHRNGDLADNRLVNLLVSPRYRYSEADLQLAEALRANGLSWALVEKLSGVPRKALKKSRKRCRPPGKRGPAGEG